MDAYAWVEYFDGTPQGERVRELVENPASTIFTNLITIAELSNHFRRRGTDFTKARQILLPLSSIHTPDISFADEAGFLHAEIRKERKHTGLADVFVLLTARKLRARVLTGDEDFRGLPEVVMIK